ncbi:MAG: linear amide C-N hydrolase [Oscillospiraceae bacterium]|nr:linear amide C-N hydrolase [Oscillospiraceae bacterium]
MKQAVRIGLLAAAALLVLAVAGAVFLFRDEVGILLSLQRLSGGVYTLRVEGDYHFEEFLSSGGASSDQEVSAFLTEKISKGFYSVPVEEQGRGCSTLSAVTPEGGHIWGRNYDWTSSVPMIVLCEPKEGYASISTCDFQNITGDPSVLPEGINQMLAIAALYVPLDGVNEAGLCVADLEVNEGGMPDPDTEKPDLTVTTAIRLLLNRAATVEEAVALLEQYDIHPSGGISHHLAISDASGNSVAVEFTEDGLAVIPTPVVTNFNLANGDPSAGGRSAQERYDALMEAAVPFGWIDEEGMLTVLDLVSQPLKPSMRDGAAQAGDELVPVSQTEEQYTTQWSIVYDQDSGRLNYFFGGIELDDMDSKWFPDCVFLFDEVFS